MRALVRQCRARLCHRRGRPRAWPNCWAVHARRAARCCAKPRDATRRPGPATWCCCSTGLRQLRPVPGLRGKAQARQIVQALLEGDPAAAEVRADGHRSALRAPFRPDRRRFRPALQAHPARRLCDLVARDRPGAAGAGADADGDWHRRGYSLTRQCAAPFDLGRAAG